MPSRNRQARGPITYTNPIERLPLINRYEYGLNAKPFSAPLRPCISNSALRSPASAEASDFCPSFLSASSSREPSTLGLPDSSCSALLSPTPTPTPTSISISTSTSTSTSGADATPSFPASAVVPAAAPFPPFPRLRTSFSQFPPRPARPP